MFKKALILVMIGILLLFMITINVEAKKATESTGTCSNALAAQVDNVQSEMEKTRFNAIKIPNLAAVDSKSYLMSGEKTNAGFSVLKMPNSENGILGNFDARMTDEWLLARKLPNSTMLLNIA